MSLLLSAYESGLREQADSAASVLYSCRACARPILTLEHDQECPGCAGLDDAEDEARRREGRRWMHQHTASLLRRLGFPGRAALYEAEGER